MTIMKIGIAGNLLIYIMVTTLCSANSNNSSEIDDLEWTLFKTQFNKMYIDNNEELNRKKVYFKSKSKIIEHNDLYEKDQYTFKMAINSFADLTHQDFVTKTNYSNEISDENNYNSNNVTFLTLKNSLIPDAIDWRTKGYVTPVRNEGRCRSDWVISAIGTIEAQNFKKTQKLIPLSVQNVIDCLKGNGLLLGCDGGMAEYAFEYIKQNEGIDTEESYPYEARVEECRYNSNNSGVTIVGYASLSYGNETELMEVVATFGPVSVGIDVSAEFRFYSSGVYYDRDWNHWSPRYTNHAMLVVGYGSDTKAGDYWIVKNSWGENWGDKGYILIARNKGNNCGIASLARIPLY